MQIKATFLQAWHYLSGLTDNATAERTYNRYTNLHVEHPNQCRYRSSERPCCLRRDTIWVPPTCPNIIFILIDDLGWRELGAYGNHERNAQHLIWGRCEVCYYASVLGCACGRSPTRAALMTGQYPARIGITTIWRSTTSISFTRLHYHHQAAEIGRLCLCRLVMALDGRL